MAGHGPPSLDLTPPVWLEGDEYRDPARYREAERFWWHNAIAIELRRLRDIRTVQNPYGLSAYPVEGIAGNLHMSVYDVAKYCRMMIGWGELVKAEPLWDFEPDHWVALAEPKGDNA